MTRKELIKLGFKLKESGNDYWYELKYKKVLFTTNDTNFNDRKDEWCVGVQVANEDTFWFNNRLKNVADFKIIFFVMCGVYSKPLSKS